MMRDVPGNRCASSITSIDGLPRARRPSLGDRAAAAWKRVLSTSTSKLRNTAGCPARTCSTNVVLPTCRAPRMTPTLQSAMMSFNSCSAALLRYIEHTKTCHYAYYKYQKRLSRIVTEFLPGIVLTNRDLQPRCSNVAPWIPARFRLVLREARSRVADLVRPRKSRSAPTGTVMIRNASLLPWTNTSNDSST